MIINKVAIIGSGVMGAGIGQVCAQHGYRVVLQDISTQALEKALNTVSKNLDKAIDKQKIRPEVKEETLSRINITTKLEDAVIDADLIIEAVLEDLDIKKALFVKIDQIAPTSALIASNTSALPITSMAGVTKRPERVLGLHFMNPVHIMKGVEVIRGMDSSDNTMDTGIKFVKSIGKEPVEGIDYGGFIVSRLLDALLNEAAYCVMDGNDPAEVDKAMKICANFPMGPCELADLAGIDIVVRGLNTLENEFGDRFHTAPLLKKMFRAGHLGRKTGKGFYNYN